jgi:hypothetical protein
VVDETSQVLRELTRHYLEKIRLEGGGGRLAGTEGGKRKQECKGKVRKGRRERVKAFQKVM